MVCEINICFGRLNVVNPLRRFGRVGCRQLCKTNPIVLVLGLEMGVGERNEAKRSQFAGGGTPGIGDWGFQEMRSGGGASAPNKANFRCFWAGNEGWAKKQSQFGPVSHSCGRSGATDPKGGARNPRQIRGPDGPNSRKAPNKANLGRRGGLCDGPFFGRGA